jgi:peptidoglycan/LPS O-acetylase OafA/YrhL
MGRPETTRTEERNAFDLFRLILALLVLYTHACFVGGFGQEGFMALVKNQTLAGSMAVLGFFGISGFLVTRSFCTRHDGPLFVRARLLRILPGFYFALLLSAFVFAPLISYFNPKSAGWGAREAFAYLASNALVLIRDLRIGGILTGLPDEESLNGALWSLFPELCCYGLIMFLGLMGVLHRSRASLVLAAVAVAVCHWAIVLFPGRAFLAPTILQLTGWSPLAAAFLMGSVIYSFRAELEPGPKGAAVWAVAVVLALKFGGWNLLGPFLLPLALVNGAYSFNARLPVDLSYGIYVLHFPILQLLAAMGANRGGYLEYFALSLVATVPFALLSWCLVERPALALKKGRATKTASP